MTPKFEKDLSFLRSWLLGKEYWEAHKALEYGHSHHIGLRKDGKTPEFHHQVQIALNARTLVPYFLLPEETLATCFLHDVIEDVDAIDRRDIEKEFGPVIAHSTELLSKKQRTSKKSTEDYFAGLATDPIASVVKGLDRCHNVWTMRGVFNKEKRESYVEEIDQWFLPMLKASRKRFPKQEPCYQNIAQQLRSMRDIYVWAHKEIEDSDC